MLPSYTEAYAAFDAAKDAQAVFGSGDEGVNAAVLCCDRHCGQDRRALTCRAPDGTTVSYGYEQLRDESSRFAAVLRELGVGPGDVVAGLLPRTFELVVTVLAAWRLGAVYQPLFTAFGPKAIAHRVSTSGAAVIVTDSTNRSKLDDPEIRTRVVTVRETDGSWIDSDVDFRAAVAKHEHGVEPVVRSVEDPLFVMFTSGTTGAAKPLFVPIRALPSFGRYLRDAVGVREDDVFWNIADPGWAYGLFYAIAAPLFLGQPTILYRGAFTAESTVQTITSLGVTNLAGSPTAFRMLIAAGEGALAGLRGQLRAVSSAGEPLNPEVIRWFAANLATTVHDQYGQTETGMVLANHHGLAHPVQPGAAGFSVPGYRVTVVDDAGEELAPGVPGNLAIDRRASPLFWFRGYAGMPTPSLGPVYYVTGDSAERNDDGSISFIGRADDVITTSGYRVGPFEVESALIEHPAVVEAAVIGKPDPERTELVKAFVVLHPSHAQAPAVALAEELRLHVKSRLSAHAYPREIEFVTSLPKTPSGKIQRFVLRQEEVARMKSDSLTE